MPKVIPVENQDGVYLFKCPGCETCHQINAMWKFNMDMECPTISPSIRVRGYGKDYKSYVCHFYITYGRIRFLDDCTHKYAGMTLELPDIKT